MTAAHFSWFRSGRGRLVSFGLVGFQARERISVWIVVSSFWVRLRLRAPAAPKQPWPLHRRPRLSSNASRLRRSMISSSNMLKARTNRLTGSIGTAVFATVLVMSGAVRSAGSRRIGAAGVSGSAAGSGSNFEA